MQIILTFPSATACKASFTRIFLISGEKKPAEFCQRLSKYLLYPVFSEPRVNYFHFLPFLVQRKLYLLNIVFVIVCVVVVVVVFATVYKTVVVSVDVICIHCCCLRFSFKYWCFVCLLRFSESIVFAAVVCVVVVISVVVAVVCVVVVVNVIVTAVVCVVVVVSAVVC